MMDEIKHCCFTTLLVRIANRKGFSTFKIHGQHMRMCGSGSIRSSDCFNAVSRETIILIPNYHLVPPSVVPTGASSGSLHDGYKCQHRILPT